MKEWRLEWGRNKARHRKSNIGQCGSPERDGWKSLVEPCTGDSGDIFFRGEDGMVFDKEVGEVAP